MAVEAKDIDDIITKLNEVTEILTKEIPLPDMDVSEWNQTPIGRAVGTVDEVREMLLDLNFEEDEDEQ